MKATTILYSLLISQAWKTVLPARDHFAKGLWVFARIAKECDSTTHFLNCVHNLSNLMRSVLFLLKHCYTQKLIFNSIISFQIQIYVGLAWETEGLMWPYFSGKMELISPPPQKKNLINGPFRNWGSLYIDPKSQNNMNKF